MIFSTRFMNRITLITVGKIKEKYFADGVKEYEKRLSRYCRLQIVEVADEKTPDKAAPAIEEQIRKTEGERILSKIPEGAFVITLELDGTMMDSVEFAEYIGNLGLYGKSHIVFIIGGSLGLHCLVSERADKKISFGKMTYPHQLMRVILLEQIYRCFRINAGEPYHK